MKIGYDFLFPAPLEVDRFLYAGATEYIIDGTRFPAPLEVDRFLYFEKISINAFYNLFPAPREVDRFFYLRFRKEY